MVLVAGDGPLKERMLARAKELNLGEGSFRMLGICEDVRLLLMAADIFLFTSRGVSEGFGLSVLEGLASGIPVVSTDIVSDFRKFCEDISILYPPGDLEQLLRACRRLIADPVEAANMGQQAQAFVHARFSTQEAVKIMISAYLDDN